MKKFLILIILFCTSFSFQSMGWGQTGHRVIGKIASKHLKRKARKALSEIMGHESLAVASTWMDEIRSDSTFDYMVDWHWVTVPDGQTYAETEKNSNGDIIEAIDRMINELTNNRENLTLEQQRNYIRILVHLVGDIHQPLHVGTGLDRGGNDVRINWFWNTPTNLHTVWDTKIIESKEYSYTELAEIIDHTIKSTIADWQSDTVLQWADESIQMRKLVYNIPEDNVLAYEYVYATWDAVQLRLHQAGIRLAGVLNEIYG